VNKITLAIKKITNAQSVDKGLQPPGDKVTYLIAGLGNPGREYKANRHNIGSMVIDQLGSRLGVQFSRLESKALVAKVNFEGIPLILAKPQTYMNLSGQSVGSLVKYYKINLDNLMVVYDDVDLPFGSLRLRPGGGSAGQKGMESIIERLGGSAFPRLRIGIGRPPGRMEAADYVLKNFSTSEAQFLPEILDRACDAIFTYLRDGIDSAMNQFNAANLENNQP
jgi:PTH1 family peptidyl-tRNA hydrolase